MNVCFLSTTYRPSHEKAQELLLMQDRLYRTKVEYMFSIKDLHPAIQKIRKHDLHLRFRDRMKVIPGGKCQDTEETTDQDTTN